MQVELVHPPLCAPFCDLGAVAGGPGGPTSQNRPFPLPLRLLCPLKPGPRGRPVLAPTASCHQPEAPCAPGPRAQKRWPGGCPLTGAQGVALNPQTDPREPRPGGPRRPWLCLAPRQGLLLLRTPPPCVSLWLTPPPTKPLRSGIRPWSLSGHAELGPETRPWRTRGPWFSSPGLPLDP